MLPCHTLCINLPVVDPCTIGAGANEVQLHCLTMIDSAGWFEIAEIPNIRADCVCNLLEVTWLAHCPWPTEFATDRGSKFAAKLKAMLKDECGISEELKTTRNPQANSMVERIHHVIHQLIHTMGIKCKSDVDPDFGWHGVLAAVHQLHAELCTQHNRQHLRS